VQQIVAVMRGRQEVGPRALGHRSLLAFPNEEAVKHKLNAIKHRQVYI
jgi:predicted NodU family carbamoyl transferase